MNLIFRTILQLIRSRRRSPLKITEVARAPFRTLLTDIDVLGHMNNGVYFSIMDLGRMDMMIRSGAWAKLREHGMYPVMVNETISFRKSLNLGQKFVLETRLVGLDVKAVYA
ncbi:MAG: thioesterase family protein, partial [Rhodoglobus sp.]|nr:thioesterase family protein [Rhodoglobus sp.]